jgi:hypothetical protein
MILVTGLNGLVVVIRTVLRHVSSIIYLSLRQSSDGGGA